MPRKLFAPLVAGAVFILLVAAPGAAGSDVGSLGSSACSPLGSSFDGGVEAQSQGTLDATTGYCSGFPRNCSGFSDF